MESARGQADQEISGSDRVAPRARVDVADDEADDVVVAGRVDAGHLGCLASQKGTAVRTTGLGEASNDFAEDGLVETPAREVVKAEERVGAGCGDVVDAVVDDVVPDPTVPSAGGGHLDLGADAVRGRGQPAAARKLVDAGERPDAGDHLGAVRGRNKGCDPLEHALVGADVDPRRLVGEPLLEHYPLPHSPGAPAAPYGAPGTLEGPPAFALHEATFVGTCGRVEEGGTGGAPGIGARGSSSAILSISSCWGTGTGYAPSKQ